MIGYKKVQCWRGNRIVGYAILKLKIIGEVVAPIGHTKKRTSCAMVLSIVETGTKIDPCTTNMRCFWQKRRIVYDHLRSMHDETRYFVDKRMTPKKKFNRNPGIDCASGIYFFDDIKGARNYGID